MKFSSSSNHCQSLGVCRPLSTFQWYLSCVFSLGFSSFIKEFPSVCFDFDQDLLPITHTDIVTFYQCVPLEDIRAEVCVESTGGKIMFSLSSVCFFLTRSCVFLIFTTRVTPIEYYFYYGVFPASAPNFSAGISTRLYTPRWVGFVKQKQVRRSSWRE